MEGIQLHVVGFSSKFGSPSSTSRIRRKGTIERKSLGAGFHTLKVSARGRSVPAEAESGEEQDDDRPHWQRIFLGEVLSPAAEMKWNKRLAQQSDLFREPETMDWCVKARRMALRTIEQKGLLDRLERMTVKKKKPKKKKSKKKSLYLDDKFDGAEAKDLDVESINAELERKVNLMDDGKFEKEKEQEKQKLVEKLSQFSGPSDRRKEFGLNRAITTAQSAEEVLEVVADTMSSVLKGLKPSPLTPLNIATALHRIAKNMEKVSLIETRRLTFARDREMLMLVAIAMSALPECSAQGISNIAWALSKIGGALLYFPEMDRIAEVAVDKVGELNAQNVANIAGAFATMHHSAPDLFSKLSKRASELVDTFQEQELTQLLWAFASLNEPANEFLDALDDAFDFTEFDPSLKENNPSISKESSEEDESSDDSEDLDDETEDLDIDEIENIMDADLSSLLKYPELNFSRDQLANMSWSLAVLGRLDRPFFSYLWTTLSKLEMESISELYKGDVLSVSQILLVNQCLKLEYPHIGLSLSGDMEEKLSRIGKTKRFNEKKTSVFQKEVGRLLVNTGLEWVREYMVDGYSLDAVLLDRKLAFEIDGPTHFSRNLGMPLGHTALKRRYLAAAGWEVVSLSFEEWDNLQGEYEQSEYLRRILNPSDPPEVSEQSA